MTWITTATVLQNLRDFENRDAWDSFAGRFREQIMAFARAMGLRQNDAEDVAQETLLAFAKAYRQGGYDPAKGRLSKFLFGIAYRQAQQARRASGRPDHVNVAGAAPDALAQVPDEQTASGVWDVEWERSVLDRCIAQARLEFEPQTFRAFELVAREGRPPEEVAQTVGVTIRAVYNAKHKIVKRIRELRLEFETSPGG